MAVHENASLASLALIPGSVALLSFMVLYTVVFCIVCRTMSQWILDSWGLIGDV